MQWNCLNITLLGLKNRQNWVVKYCWLVVDYNYMSLDSEMVVDLEIVVDFDYILLDSESENW